MSEDRPPSSLQRELSSYVEDLTTAIKDLIKQSENDGEVKGIGIGAPNGNYYKGTIEFAPNLKWAYDENDKPMVIFFAKMIRDIVGIPGPSPTTPTPPRSER